MRRVLRNPFRGRDCIAAIEDSRIVELAGVLTAAGPTTLSTTSTNFGPEKRREPRTRTLIAGEYKNHHEHQRAASPLRRPTQT